MPMKRELYPDNWEEISLRVRTEAGWRCEGSPDYPDCRAENGKPHPITGSKVVLTVAHLDHTPANCERDNLKAWCQRCHLNYDRKHRLAQLKANTWPDISRWDLGYESRPVSTGIKCSHCSRPAVPGEEWYMGWKGPKSRQVYLCPACQEALHQYRRARREAQEIADTAYRKAGIAERRKARKEQAVLDEHARRQQAILDERTRKAHPQYEQKVLL